MSGERKSPFEGHTPGPWTIEPHGDGFALYSGRDGQHHGLNLVHLKEPDRNWDNNAALISAAPTLLRRRDDLAEALRKIEARGCDYSTPEEAAYRCPCGACIARFALAKLEAEP